MSSSRLLIDHQTVTLGYQSIASGSVVSGFRPGDECPDKTSVVSHQRAKRKKRRRRRGGGEEEGEAVRSGGAKGIKSCRGRAIEEEEKEEEKKKKEEEQEEEEVRSKRRTKKPKSNPKPKATTTATSYV
ncbi:Hypothetical predicted protein [Xyrichtys novacula]|uniref:Uncharacterized protein n=1 Tax=Xyrichtys novacula TaxID=13765 RepID=A0AAV1HAD7_XYRNO|nr:Hypothetical predicted protein [Xyrichtys novacula]